MVATIKHGRICSYSTMETEPCDMVAEILLHRATFSLPSAWLLTVTVHPLLHGLQVLDELVVRVQVPPLGPSGVVAHRVLLAVSRRRHRYMA